MSILGCNVTEGYTYHDMDTLLSTLFNDSRYNNQIRPVFNQSRSVQVGGGYVI